MNSLLTRAGIYDTLTRDKIATMVKIHDLIDHRKAAPLALKCREHCANTVMGWSRAVNEVDNAIIQAIRRDGPYPTRDFAAAMAAVEDAALAELARDALTDKEFVMLSRPAFEAAYGPEWQTYVATADKPIPEEALVLEAGDPGELDEDELAALLGEGDTDAQPESAAEELGSPVMLEESGRPELTIAAATPTDDDEENDLDFLLWAM